MPSIYETTIERLSAYLSISRVSPSVQKAIVKLREQEEEANNIQVLGKSFLCFD